MERTCSLQKLKDGLWSGDAKKKKLLEKFDRVTGVSRVIQFPGTALGGEKRLGGVKFSTREVIRSIYIYVKPILRMSTNCYNYVTCEIATAYMDPLRRKSRFFVFEINCNGNVYRKIVCHRRFSVLLAEYQRTDSTDGGTLGRRRRGKRQNENCSCLVREGIFGKGGWPWHAPLFSSEISVVHSRRVSIEENNRNKKGYHVATIN